MESWCQSDLKALFLVPRLSNLTQHRSSSLLTQQTANFWIIFEICAADLWFTVLDLLGGSRIWRWGSDVISNHRRIESANKQTSIVCHWLRRHRDKYCSTWCRGELCDKFPTYIQMSLLFYGPLKDNSARPFSLCCLWWTIDRNSLLGYRHITGMRS